MPPKHSKEVVKSKSIPQDEITKKIEALQCEALTLTYKRELDVAIEVLDKIVSFLGTIQSSCSTLSQKNIDLYNEAFDEFYCALSQYSTDKNDLAFYEKLVAMLQASVSLTKNVDHIKNYSTRSEELLSLCKEIPDQNAAKAKKLENAYKHYTEAHLKLLKSFYDSSDIAQQGNFSSSTQKYLTSLVTEDLKSDSIFESLSALLELIHSHKDASCKEEMYIALIERLRDPSLGDKVKPLLSEVYANFGTYNLKLDKVKSEILYKNALIENPSNHSAHLRLGMSCYKRREFEKALEHYEAADSAFQAIHHKHNYLYVWNAMRTTLNTNDYQKSVDLLQTCSKLDPAESTETNTSPKHFQENKDAIITNFKDKINKLSKEFKYQDAVILWNGVCKLEASFDNIKEYFAAVAKVVSGMKHDDGAKYLADAIAFWKEIQPSLVEPGSKQSISCDQLLNQKIHKIISDIYNNIILTNLQREIAVCEKLISALNVMPATDKILADTTTRLKELQTKSAQLTIELTPDQAPSSKPLTASPAAPDASDTSIEEKLLFTQQALLAKALVVRESADKLSAQEKQKNLEYAALLEARAMSVSKVALPETLMAASKSVESQSGNVLALPEPLTASDLPNSGKKGQKTKSTKTTTLQKEPEVKKDLGKIAYEDGVNALSDKDNKDYELAVTKFREATSYSPNNPEYHHVLARTLYELNKFDEAIESYTKAIELKPGSHSYYHNRGIAYDAKSEYDKAVKDLGKAIELGGSSKEYHANYADALMALPTPTTIEEQVLALWVCNNAQSETKYSEKLATIHELIKASDARSCDLKIPGVITIEFARCLSDALRGNTKLLHLNFHSNIIHADAQEFLKKICSSTSVINIKSGEWLFNSQVNIDKRMEFLTKLFPDQYYKDESALVLYVREHIESMPGLEEILSEIKPRITAPFIKAIFQDIADDDLMNAQDKFILAVVGHLFTKSDDSYKEIIANDKYHFDITKHLNVICNAVKGSNKIAFILACCGTKAIDTKLLDAIKITNNTEVALCKQFCTISPDTRSIYLHFFNVIAKQLKTISDVQLVMDTCAARDDLKLLLLEHIAFLEPNNPEYQENVAKFYIFMGENKKAFDSYKKAIKLVMEQMPVAAEEGADSVLIVKLDQLCMEFENLHSDDKHQEKIALLAEASDFRARASEIYGAEIGAYKAKSVTPPPSERKTPPLTTTPPPKKKGVSFEPEVEFKASWKIGGKTYEHDEQYIVRVNGLGHNNCYAAIKKDTFDTFDAVVRTKLKKAIDHAAAPKGESGIKKHEQDLLELKILGSQAHGDIRLVPQNIFKSNGADLIVFDIAGTHRDIAKVKAVFELDCTCATDPSWALDLAAIGSDAAPADVL